MEGGTSRRVTYPRATSGVIGRPTGLQLGTSGGPTNDQSVTWGYDTYGRFNSFVGGGTTLAYTYTSNSNLLASIADATSGWTQTRTYLDKRDLLDAIETKISTTTKAKFDYDPAGDGSGYDVLGRRTKVAKTGDSTTGMFIRYGNGSEGLTTYYGYDDRSQLTSEVTKVGTGSTVLTGRDDAYAFDNIGNRHSTNGTTHNGNTANYTTNALNQYTQRTVPGVFDVAGAADAGATVTVNGSSSGVTHGGAYGQYFFKGQTMANGSNTPVFATLEVSDGTDEEDIAAFLAGTPEDFDYDADGNLLYDGRWSYTYDAENRLIAIQTKTALFPSPIPAADARRIEFKNDYLGRRVQKTVLKRNTGNTAWEAVTNGDEKFVYDGWNAIAKLNASSNAIVASYYWGLDWSGTLQGAGGVGGLILTVEGSNSYLPIYDGNGNVMGMIKASNGSIDAAYEYDAFGNTLRESGTYAASNPFRFSTKYTDIETDLVYYGLRYYSPSLGRFINKDPIEEHGGLNLYGFVENNAVNRWDYLGMFDPYGGDRMLPPHLREGAAFPNISISYRAPKDFSFGIQSKIFTANISIGLGSTVMHEFTHPIRTSQTVWAPAQTLSAFAVLGFGDDKYQVNLFSASATYYESTFINYEDFWGMTRGVEIPLSDWSFNEIAPNFELEATGFEQGEITGTISTDSPTSIDLSLFGIGVGSLDLSLRNNAFADPAPHSPFRSGPSVAAANLSNPTGSTGNVYYQATPGTLALETFVVRGTMPKDIEVSSSLLGSLNVTITDPAKIAEIMDSMNQKDIPSFRGLAK